MRDLAPQAWRTRKVREWLLAVLRFAVTLEPADRTTVLAIAEEIDRSGLPTVSFAFFVRTTTELCHAIADIDDPQRIAILHRHLKRIDDPRLQRAFGAAIGLHTF